MLLVVVAMGILGALFTIREWWWLYAVGIWLYMALIPAVEASEQTVIQKVVPFRDPGSRLRPRRGARVGRRAVTAFLIAPIAQFWIIPYMDSDAGQQTWGWLLGDGEARGIALVFLVSGLVMVVVALLAFTTRSYRTLSEEYERAPEQTEASAPARRAPGSTRTARPTEARRSRRCRGADASLGTTGP